MLSRFDKIKLLWLLLYNVVNFFINKAELKLSLMFHDEWYLVEFASFTNKNTYNIQSITPPHILRATLSESDCPLIEITIQRLGKNDLERFMPTVSSEYGCGGRDTYRGWSDFACKSYCNWIGGLQWCFILPYQIWSLNNKRGFI